MHIVINHPDYKSAEWWKYKCKKKFNKEPDFKLMHGFRWQSSIEITCRRNVFRSLDEQWGSEQKGEN